MSFTSLKLKVSNWLASYRAFFGCCYFIAWQFIAAIEPLAAQQVSAVSFLRPVAIAADKSAAARVSGLITSDFNNDGKSDIAILWTDESRHHELFVYLGKGDGTFLPGQQLIGANLGSSLFVADINHDGKPDLAVANGESVQVFLSTVGGGFLAPIVTSTTLGTPLIADYDGDGIQDLIIAGYYGNQTNSINTQSTFYVGKGDGTFGGPVTSPLIPLTIADVNGDYIPDILGYSAKSEPGGPPSVFLGRGHGLFQDGLPAPFVGLFGDFNNDGFLDLVDPGNDGSGVSFGTTGRISLGNGDGTFKVPTTFDGIAGVAFASDFNGDGKLDIYSGFSVITGNGDGTFNRPIFLYAPLGGCFGSPASCHPSGINFAIPADLNRDGKLDVIYSVSGTYFDYNSQVLSFVNAGVGDGILQPAVPAATGAGLPATHSIVSMYGVNLAGTTETATGPPYPTVLGGVRLYVNDKPAELFYVSPTQINYVLPPLVVIQFSFPTIDLEHVGQPFVPKGIAAPIVDDSPSLFTVDLSGLAAATAVRISPSGNQTPVPVFSCPTQQCEAIPIDTAGDPVYLSVYGTGMNRLDSYPLCSAGTVVYAGPQGQIPGMQQINIRLNRSSTPGVATRKEFSCLEQIISGIPNSPLPKTTNPVSIVIK